jgi:CRP-like cAMP-binding protein
MAIKTKVTPPLRNPQEPKVERELERLRQLVPLDNMSHNSLRHILDHTHVFRAHQGDILFDVGDTKPFTFFLLRGALKLKHPKGNRIIVESGTDRGRYAISNLLPRQYRARVASKQALIARMDRDLLEKEVAWGQLSCTDKKGEELADNDWKITLLRTPTFSRLPMANVQQLFEELQEFPAKAGEVIIREGEPGDYYYIIHKGKCRVVRKFGGREIKLGVLEESDAFGDEALVSDKPRNATVVMETDGMLMRLSKANFQELIHTPLVKRIDLENAMRTVTEGKALLIDVRMEEEFIANRLPHALNIPAFLLYLKTQSLNRRLKYIVYCETGDCSAAAAFILTCRGFDSYVLKEPAQALATVDS